MIASRSGAQPLPRVIWRREAKRSLKALMAFLEEKGCIYCDERRAEIEEAAESLRHSPLRCAVLFVRGGLKYRRLVVDERFLVYYIYTPPRGMSAGGTISVRAVRHAASQNPFDCVRDPLYGDQPHAAVDEADAPVDIVYLDNSMLENRVVSECGRFESFDFRGQHFEVDWDEIVGDDDEEEIPHEQVMEEMRLYCEELAARRGRQR